MLRTALGALPSALRDVPVEPDAETARRWAVTELSDPVYHERPSLLELALEWLVEQLAGIETAATGLDARAAALIIVAVVVVGALVALVVAGPVRRARAAGRGSATVFVDDTRSAAELRASADAHAAQGMWAEAVLDRFRALLRSLEDRALLDERPGRTAHEASAEAADRLPTCAGDLRRAGRLFDDVCYGHAEARSEEDAWLREVDEAVAATRPVMPGAASPDREEALT
ncbi:DUF4129 domain-containing protein [Actinotalea sp. BY-33]|uniref:DUF4129 domain-containing protein n=1 Tax=Actinotalea soli TaxID=2819234 RepID=A0A939LMP2_9CELL|nr:DUF4129 domain-containing protein [Actinotalea soli]